MRCTVCGGTAFAVWYHQPSTNVSALCRPHLDTWLDNADAEPALEPAQLIFLPPDAAVRFLTWPVLR